MVPKRLSFLVVLATIASMAVAQLKFEQVKINQVGYEPEMTKIAVVPNTGAKKFQIRDQESGKVVYKGKLTDEKKWEPSQEIVKQADFSDFSSGGTYVLEVKDTSIEPSYPFKIGEDVYADLADAALHGFYLARCSMPIEEEYAGIYHRPLAFPDTMVLVHSSAASAARPEGTVISSPRGWLDAGDYNKYVVNSGITTYTLLHLYEVYPGYFKNLVLNIPEKTNDIPDLLDEALYNLRWMMTMQDPEDGGVYHKLTTLKFQGFLPPHKASKQRYVVAKSTSAAYNLAAVCAKASRVFKPYENELPGFSDSCMQIASKAMAWATEHPEVYFKNPKGINTGAYDDKNLEDEKFWAETEWALSTHKPLPELPEPKNLQEASWSDVSALGFYSLASAGKLDGNMKTAFLKKAGKLLEIYFESAYPVSMKKFVWGSNSVALNQGIYLMMAYQITGEKKYLEAAEGALNYVLGTNATGYCFVTGFGTHFPNDIHDRRSASDSIEGAIPGYLVGGPNIADMSDCAEGKRSPEIPAISYVDEQCSYSTNEIAINWQAALTFMTFAILNAR